MKKVSKPLPEPVKKGKHLTGEARFLANQAKKARKAEQVAQAVAGEIEM